MAKKFYVINKILTEGRANSKNGARITLVDKKLGIIGHLAIFSNKKKAMKFAGHGDEIITMEEAQNG